jgi:methionyl-tRNA synthetase
VKTLVTSALPYINGIKHIGNLAGSILPADIHSRNLRQVCKEVLFVCGTDEHGTPAEIAAQRAGKSIQEFCLENHLLQAESYKAFNVEFDHFGRTSSPENHEATQKLFLQLESQGLIEEKEVDQIWSEADQRFLPDRYVEGECPFCHGSARGDQCDECSSPLSPAELINPRSVLTGSHQLEVRKSRHLFFRQSEVQGVLSNWLETREEWSHLAKSDAASWIQKGLQDRCITRDLEWGVKVPKPGYEDKVFYVWFDAPVGYISATQEWCSEHGKTISDWWSKESDVSHVQFLAKDNGYFHEIAFPSTLLGSGANYHTVDVIKSVNWLQFDGRKFSTSKGDGIFIDEALALAEADRWRWWLFANCPENSDTDFTFRNFVETTNSDLSDNLGNLVSRVTGFANANQDKLQEGWDILSEDRDLEEELNGVLADLLKYRELIQFRKQAESIRRIWSIANRYFANSEPWKVVKADPLKASQIVRTTLVLIRICALVAWPVIPETSRKILQSLGGNDDHEIQGWTIDKFNKDFSLGEIQKAPPFFPKLILDNVENAFQDLVDRRKEKAGL